MRLKDAEGWAKTVEANRPSADDPGYGQAVIDFALCWANAMEDELANGKTVAEVAEACEPKGLGITGFQYGCAVSILSQVWENGDDLRRWHNGNYGRPDANGTINPAILAIG